MVLTSILESLIFAAEKPLAVKQLGELTDSPLDQVRQALAELSAQYQDAGIVLVEVSSGYQFRTHPKNAAWVKRLLAGPPARLTRPMLESLAIIAYRQPITRPEIDDIRGVDSASTIRVLLERNLIRIMGKKEDVGRPILYGTTKYFLEFFQLRDLKDLPSLKDYTELSEEHAAEFETRFGDGASEEALTLLRERRAVEEMAALVDAVADAHGIDPAVAAGAGAPPPAEPCDASSDAAARPATKSQTASPPSAEASDALQDEEDALAALDRALARADGVLADVKQNAVKPTATEPPTAAPG